MSVVCCCRLDIVSCVGPRTQQQLNAAMGGGMAGGIGSLGTRGALESRGGVAMGARPMTGVVSAGRGVRDKFFYLGAIRELLDVVVKEGTALREKNIELAMFIDTRQVLEQRRETITEEVRKLRHKLGSVNAMREHLASGRHVDVDEIAARASKVSDAHQSVRRVLSTKMQDQLQLRGENEQLEALITRIQTKLSEHVQELPEAKRTEYEASEAERSLLVQRLKASQGLLRENRSQIAQLEATCALDATKADVLALWRRRRDIAASVDRAHAQRKGILGGHDSISALRRQLQDDKAETKRLVSMERDLDAQRASLEQKADRDARKEDDPRIAQWQKLKGKGDSVDRILSTFPEHISTKKEELGGDQTRVVALLEYISRTLGAAQSGGGDESVAMSQSKFDELKGEAEYKRRKVADTESTQQKLEKELADKGKALRDLDQLDQRFHDERNEMEARMDKMKAVMKDYAQLDEHRAASIEKQAYLKSEIQRLIALRTSIGGEAEQVRRATAAVKARVESMDEHQKLAHLQKQLGTTGTKNFQLATYVQERLSSSSYDTIRDDCMSIVETLQSHLAQTGVGAPVMSRHR